MERETRSVIYHGLPLFMTFKRRHQVFLLFVFPGREKKPILAQALSTISLVILRVGIKLCVVWKIVSFIFIKSDFLFFI